MEYARFLLSVKLLGGEFAEEKCTPKQVEMCFEAKNNKNWQVYFD